MFRFRIVGDFLSLIKIQVHTSNKNMNITKLQHNLRHHHELCRPARMSEMWKTVKTALGDPGYTGVSFSHVYADSIENGSNQGLFGLQ